MEKAYFKDKDIDQLMREELHEQGVIQRCHEEAKKLKHQADTGEDLKAEPRTIKKRDFVLWKPEPLKISKQVQYVIDACPIK